MSTPYVDEFQYVDLNQVDPNFSLLDEEVYNFVISKAERKPYGTEGKSRIVFTLTVTQHQKFAGRKLFPSLFFSEFTLKSLRRIADATGVPQTPGDMDGWLKDLSTIQPPVKLKVIKVPDGKTTKDKVTNELIFTPNPNTVKTDGTPDTVNAVDWKAGVLPGDN
jgi:hypothetical protein